MTVESLPSPGRTHVAECPAHKRCLLKTKMDHWPKRLWLCRFSLGESLVLPNGLATTADPGEQGQLGSRSLSGPVAFLLLLHSCELEIWELRAYPGVPTPAVPRAAPGLSLPCETVCLNNLISRRYSTIEAPSQVSRNSQAWSSPLWVQYLSNSISSRESTSRKIVCVEPLWT